MVGKWIGAAPTQSELGNSGIFDISDIHYLKDEGEYIKVFAFQCEYLVVGGGGIGPGGFSGGYGAGGGGAGGLRNSYASENTGGGGSTEATKGIVLGQTYSITIAAGSTNVGSGDLGVAATPSKFDTVEAIGGGNGSRFGSTVNIADSGFASGPGQAGRGTSGTFTTYLFTPVQGYVGADRSGYTGGAGGGAAGTGTHLASSITGSAVNYADGGGGGRNTAHYNGTAGAANTGNGGTAGAYAGAGYGSTQGGAGGSGVVILRYPNTYTISVGAGLTTAGEQTDGSDKYIKFTGGTDTVSWS